MQADADEWLRSTHFHASAQSSHVSVSTMCVEHTTHARARAQSASHAPLALHVSYVCSMLVSSTRARSLLVRAIHVDVDGLYESVRGASRVWKALWRVAAGGGRRGEGKPHNNLGERNSDEKY